MRYAVSAFMALLLVTLVTVCPLMSCAADTDSSLNHACCHRHTGGTPCAPKTQVQPCTYSLLDRSTPAPAVTAAVPPVVVPVAGVPALSLEVASSDYDNRHHTIIDTFDRIDPRALALDTAALALASYLIASADEAPGRRLSTEEVEPLLKKTGQFDYVELDFSKDELRH